MQKERQKKLEDGSSSSSNSLSSDDSTTQVKDNRLRQAEISDEIAKIIRFLDNAKDIFDKEE